IGQDPGSVDDTVQTLAKDGKAYGITADLTDREQVDLVREQLAGEHADATLLVNAAGFFVPKPFLEHDDAFYDAYLELDRAIFFLTQTVARGMIAHGRGGSIVNIGSMWAHKAIGATPSSAYSVAKAGLHAHRPRPGQHNHLPALPGHQLGHRRHLGRRRRRHGRTQLTTPDCPRAGPTTRRAGHAPSTAVPQMQAITIPGRTRWHMWRGTASPVMTYCARYRSTTGWSPSSSSLRMVSARPDRKSTRLNSS